MVSIIFAFGSLCAYALWKLRIDIRDSIESMAPRISALLDDFRAFLALPVVWWKQWLRREVFVVIALGLLVLGVSACGSGQQPEVRARTAVEQPAKVLVEDS